MLRVHRIALVASLLIGVTAAFSLAPAGGHAQQTPSALPIVAGGPFTLVATSGNTVTDRNYRGKWLLIYFGYTFCPDVCPTTLSAIAGALDELGKRAAKVQPIFVTIDPRRDTPEILAGYVGAIDKRIVALTGTPAQIHAAARAYGVIYERQDADNGGYTFDHTSYIYLVDPEGKFVETLSDSADRNNIVRRLSDLIGRKP